MRQRAGTTKPKTWKPTRKQLEVARAQERGYRSQGKAIKKVARVQRRRGVGTPTAGPGLVTYKEAKRAGREGAAFQIRNRRRGLEQRRRQQVRDKRAEKRIVKLVQALDQERAYTNYGRIAGPPTPYKRPDKEVLENLGPLRIAQAGPLAGPQLLAAKLADKAGLIKASQAPAAAALEETQRPLYAIANAAKHDVKLIKEKGLKGLVGNSPLPAAKKGWDKKEKTTFSDVLGEAGVKNPVVKAVVGFALDVGLDPTTYLTLGTASVARQAAVKGATQAAKSAGKRGASKAEQRRIFRDTEQRLTTQYEKTAKGRERGLDVRLAGARVPGVSRAAHRASREVSNATRVLAKPITDREATKTAARAGRNVAASLHGGVRRSSVAKSERATLEGLQRETRAQRETQGRRGTERANAILGSFTEAEQRLILDAIENKTVRALKGAASKRKVSLRAARPQPIRRVRRGTSERKARGGSDRLYQAAVTVRSELRYQHRQARRAGPISGDVEAPWRAEQTLSAKATTPSARAPSARTMKSMKAKLPKARRQVVEARKAFDEATERLSKAKPAERAQAREAVDETRQALIAANRREASLRRGIGGAERAARISQAAGHGRRTLTRRRKATSAKGYYPRYLKDEQAEKEGILTRLAGDVSGATVPKYAGDSIGSAKPKPSAAHQRKLPPSRKQLDEEAAAKEEPSITDIWSENPRVDLARYTREAAGATAAGNLNLKMLQELGTKLRPGLTKGGLRALERSSDPTYVYRVRQGKMERLSADNDWGVIEKIKGGGALPTGGQYALLPKRLEREVRDAQPTIGSDIAALQAFDWAQSGFKGLALATPGYLTRNFTGDLWNSNLFEGNKIRLVGNLFKGGKALNALGRYERSLRRFGSEIPEKKRTIKLSDEQAHVVAQMMKGAAPEKDIANLLATRKVNALQVALLAERAGAIRQGRFLELMDEGRGLRQLRGAGLWRNLTKRVEDSVRIGTFLGGMSRGMLPRQAAQLASDYHIDYGKLTSFEKGIMRRLMPFYTFTSRNIPIQAKAFVTRPGRFATLEKARETGRKAAGLEEDYEQTDLDPYEARQLGIPVPLGGGRSTRVSFGSPFVDLNDIVSTASGNLNAPVFKAGEMLGPWKTIGELAYNQSLFYRDLIEPEGAPDTRAPEWAVKIAESGAMGKKWAESLGMRPDFIDETTGDQAWGWNKKTDYKMRQLAVGPLGVILRFPGADVGPVELPQLGVKTQTSRDQGPLEAFATSLGVRVKEVQPPAAERNRLYREQDELNKRQERLRQSAHPRARRPNGKPHKIGEEHSTPEYRRNARRLSEIEKALVRIERKIKKGGYVRGKPTESYRKPRGGGVAGDGLTLDETLGELVLEE